VFIGGFAFTDGPGERLLIARSVRRVGAVGPAGPAFRRSTAPGRAWSRSTCYGGTSGGDPRWGTRNPRAMRRVRPRERCDGASRS